MPERRPTLELHDAMPAVRSLVPSERDVVTGRLVDLDRDDKGGRRRSRRDEPDPGAAANASPPPRGRFPRWAVVAGGAALVVVVVGGVAVATGGLGGGGAAPSTPDSTASAQPEETPLPPELDPAQVASFSGTLSRTAVEAGQGLTVDPSWAVGSTSEWLLTCDEGICGDGRWSFDMRQATVDETLVIPSDDADFATTPCSPYTMHVMLTRAADGTYVGTATVEAAQIYAEWGDGESCSTANTADDVVLSPVLDQPEEEAAP